MKSYRKKIASFALLAVLLCTPSGTYAAAPSEATITRERSASTVQREWSPVRVFDDDALWIAWSDDTEAIVGYDLSYDGQWIDVSYLDEHMDTTSLVYDDVWYLPPSIGLYATELSTAADYPLLDWDAPVGTGTMVVYVNHTARQMINAAIVVMGDVQCTGQLGLSQLITMASMMQHPEQYSYLQIIAGDWNNDGRVTLTDVITEASIYRASLAPPVSASDFVLHIDGDDELERNGGDVLSVMDEHGWSLFYTEQGDVFTTGRGIQIGSSMRQVHLAFGITPEYRYNRSLFDLSNDAAAAWITSFDADCEWTLCYSSKENRYRIIFFFDGDAKVIAMAFEREQ